MTVFEDIKSKNIDELAEWLNDNGCDDSPWIHWFDKNYCKKCDCIPADESTPWKECAWCEVHNKCRFFPEMDKAPDCLQICKMWLETEA